MNWFTRIFSRGKYQPGYVDSTRGLWTSSGGSSVNPDSALQVSAFYRGVMYISTQMAKLPWHVKKYDTNEMSRDSLWRLLNISPNEEMTAFVFKSWIVQQAIVQGNGYAEIERDAIGRVKALWPIPSDSVDLVRFSNGKLAYRIMGGNITSANDIYISPEDMFHLKNPLTKDGLKGQGVVSYASEVLGISLGADKFANSLFANGGMPSGILTFKGALDDEAYERVRKSWKESHGGRKSGGVAILEEDAKYESVSMQPDVMQFLESRKFNVLEIARFLGVPPTKLFDTEAASYANQEQSALEVVTDALDAWARNLESEADFKLISDYSRFTELDLYAIFRGDMNTRSTYFQKQMQAGAITPNEIRLKEGMAPYKGGDRFFIANNNFIPQDRMDEVIDSQISKNTQPPTPPQDKPTPPTKNPKAELLEEDLLKATVDFLTAKK